jgi:5-formyltetrahydrofolate cyclo-ligase
MSEPPVTATKQKRELRRNMRASRAGLDDETRERASRRIAGTVVHAGFFSRARSIACYLPMAEEVDTWPIIARAWRRKKRIFVPLTVRERILTFREVTPDSDLVHNEWGLLEPVSGDVIEPKELDVVLTPLVAFDAERHRIGMGGGYYDRTFAFLHERRRRFRPKLVGLAFDCQRTEKIAVNPWDITLYRVITESGQT